MPSQELQEILALDIGTRTVGVVLQNPRAATISEQRSCMSERAMYDGQVHNVAAVAQGVSKVKTTERRRKKIFPRAAVAAAGRTQRWPPAKLNKRAGLSEVTAAEYGTGARSFAPRPNSINPTEGETAAGFFCVGYSISQYLLEGHPISGW